MKKILIILILFGFLLFPIVTYGFDYVTFTPFPAPGTGNCSGYATSSQPRPAAGSSFNDQRFNTPITRISDYQVRGHFTAVQYTPFTCSNSDSTKVAFNPSSTTSVDVYSVTNNAFLGTASNTCNETANFWGTQEFRWSHDPATPNVGYFRYQKRICKVDISGGFPGVQKTVKDFSTEMPNGNVIMLGNDKGEQSRAQIGGYYDRYWPIINGNWGDTVTNLDYLAMWDRVTDTTYKVRLSDLCKAQGWSGCGSVRWATMSPSGDRLLAKIYCTGCGSCGIRFIALKRPASGTTLELAWTYDGQCDYSHPAWGYTLEGVEIIFFCDNFPNVTAFRISDGTPIIYFQVGGPGSECSSCMSGCGFQGCANHWTMANSRNLDGWLFGTGYGSADNDWLEKELIGIRLSSDPTKIKVWRIAFTYDGASSPYWSQGKAQITQDGQNIYFSSCWGTNDQSQIDIYRATLPKNWWSEIGGSPGDPGPSPPKDVGISPRP